MKRKVVLVAGALLLAANFVFPPWSFQPESRTTRIDLGHSWIFSPPEPPPGNVDEMRPNPRAVGGFERTGVKLPAFGTVSIAWTKLAAQILATAAVTAAAFFAVPKERSP